MRSWYRNRQLRGLSSISCQAATMKVVHLSTMAVFTFDCFSAALFFLCFISSKV